MITVEYTIVAPEAVSLYTTFSNPMPLRSSNDVTIVGNGGRAAVGTGIAFACPASHAGFLTIGLDLAVTTRLSVLNSPGLIDSSYRGEIKVLLVNQHAEPYSVRAGDTIAEITFRSVETVAISDKIR